MLVEKWVGKRLESVLWDTSYNIILEETGDYYYDQSRRTYYIYQKAFHRCSKYTARCRKSVVGIRKYCRYSQLPLLQQRQGYPLWTQMR